MNRKIRVGIVFGGKSPEHEVSLLSAKNVIEAIDREKFEIELIGIDKNGEWHLKDASQYLENAHHPKMIRLNDTKEALSIVPRSNGEQLVNIETRQAIQQLDVVFPVLHGCNGEDGTIQGLLQLAGIPYVGCGVLSSSVCMDKDVAKRLLRDAGIPIAKFLCFKKKDLNHISFAEVKKELGLPLFVKPANTGSSVGVSKVKNEEDFINAIQEAFDHDTKILVEEYIEGREVECAVLGNEFPLASIPGEIIPTHEFYSYEAKYIDPNGAHLSIPANLDQEKMEEVRNLSVRAYEALCCEGMARVDMFVKEDGSLFVNEINTIPGFTNISMYPKMWQVSGVSYPELIERLILLAIERDASKKGIKTSFELKVKDSFTINLDKTLASKEELLR